MELGQILEGKEAQEVVEQPAKEVQETKDRDEKGRFAKGETPETPAGETDKEPLDPKAKAFYAKAQDERRKRQEAERERDELRSRLQTPPPDVLENPQGYTQHIEERIRLNDLNNRLNLTEELAREKYGDDAIAEAQELFMQETKADPTLAHKLVTERNPYGWLMKWAKGRKFATEMGDDPEAYLAKKKAEWEAEYTAKQAARTSQPAPPPSLAASPSASVRDVAWTGPTPLNNILKR